MKKRDWWISGLLLVAVGAGLRFVNLTGWDLWTDEVQTLLMSQRGEFSFGPMYSTAPVNFWVTALSVELFESDLLGLRFVPWLAGSTSLAVFFFACRRWTDRLASVVGTAVLALSMWHVAWSQTGRHFALETLILLVALYLFVEYWRRGRVWTLVLSSGLLLLGLFTHSSAGFYAGGLALFAGGKLLVGWWRGPDADRPMRETALAFAAAALPLLIYAPFYLRVGSYVLQERAAWNPPWNIAGSYAFYIPVILELFAVAGFILLYRDGKRDLAMMLAAFTIVPMLLLMVASGITIASAAYALPSIIGIAAAAGVTGARLIRGRDEAGRMGRTSVAGVLVVGGLLLGQAYDLAHYYLFYNGLKARWGDVAEYIGEHRSPGEYVLADEGDVMNYYLGNGRVFELETESRQKVRGTSTGIWVVKYLVKEPKLSLPDGDTSTSFESARIRAVFPLHYGAKIRTLVVYYRPPEG